MAPCPGSSSSSPDLDPQMHSVLSMPWGGRWAR
jgi:hypothetical protein